MPWLLNNWVNTRPVPALMVPVLVIGLVMVRLARLSVPLLLMGPVAVQLTVLLVGISMVPPVMLMAPLPASVPPYRPNRPLTLSGPLLVMVPPYILSAVLTGITVDPAPLVLKVSPPFCSVSEPFGKFRSVKAKVRFGLLMTRSPLPENAKLAPLT